MRLEPQRRVIASQGKITEKEIPYVKMYVPIGILFDREWILITRHFLKKRSLKI